MLRVSVTLCTRLRPRINAFIAPLAVQSATTRPTPARAAPLVEFVWTRVRVSVTSWSAASGMAPSIDSTSVLMVFSLETRPNTPTATSSTAGIARNA